MGFREGSTRNAAAPSPSLRATGSRERAPDDRLREAIHAAAPASSKMVIARL